jgi:hypothetical protein
VEVATKLRERLKAAVPMPTGVLCAAQPCACCVMHIEYPPTQVRPTVGPTPTLQLGGHAHGRVVRKSFDLDAQVPTRWTGSA